MDGYINLGLDSHSFHLDPDRCQGQCEIETENAVLWYTFVFYHTAESNSLTVVIGEILLNIPVSHFKPGRRLHNIGDGGMGEFKVLE